MVNWFYLWRAADGPNDLPNCYFVMPHIHPGLSSHGWPMLMGAASTQAQGYPLPCHQPSINASACPCLHSLPEQLAEPLLHTQRHIDTHLVHYLSLYQGDANLCLSIPYPVLAWYTSSRDRFCCHSLSKMKSRALYHMYGEIPEEWPTLLAFTCLGVKSVWCVFGHKWLSVHGGKLQ